MSTPENQITAPSELLKDNVRSLQLEPLGFNLSTVESFTLISRVFQMLQLGVDNPGAIRLEMAAQELRIKHNTDVLLIARKPNGTDAWNVQAEYQIRRVINPEFVKFSY